MAIRLTEKFKKISLLILTVLLIFSSFGVSGGVYAAAETEESDSVIMRELSCLTLDGVRFNAEDYPADEEGAPQLLYLSELGYGSTPEKQVAFGLTLYIYNPAQLDIVQDVRNTVQMKIGGAERYSKYGLNVIEGSSDKLFFKLGVSFTDEEKGAALATLNKDGRRYEVSSVEFYVEGFNATDYPIARTFQYTGYAAGLGEDGADTLRNTLSYIEEGGTETIPLEVHHTSWRPEGTNGNSKYTQDTIHSVYFAVPKEQDEQYDYLKSVQARWLRARTATVFVTDNSGAYSSIDELKKANAEAINNADDGNLTTGPDNPNADIRPNAPSEFKLSFDGWDYTYAFGHLQKGNNVSLDGLTLANSFGANSKWMIRSNTAMQPFTTMDKLKTLYLSVFTNDIIADRYVVSSEELTELVREETENGYFYNDRKVAGKYPSHLFSNYDNDFTTTIITVGEFDKNLSLHSEQVSQRWWQKLFGGYTAENQKEFEGIRAIQPLSDEDVNESKSDEELSKSLYISQRDIKDFRAFYEGNKNNATIYLLRFAVSEYYSRETDNLHVNKFGGIWAYDLNAGSGYYAQTECYLDFDVIDLEYVKEGASYVIPVSMSPIDIFPELTPPPKYYDFWKYAAVIMAVLIGFYIVYKVVGKAI